MTDNSHNNLIISRVALFAGDKIENINRNYNSLSTKEFMTFTNFLSTLLLFCITNTMALWYGLKWITFSFPNKTRSIWKFCPFYTELCETKKRRKKIQNKNWTISIIQKLPTTLMDIIQPSHSNFRILFSSHFYSSGL